MYKIIRQRRKSVTIHIEDDLSIVVKAPYDISHEEIDKIVTKHEVWINKTIRDKENLARRKDWLHNGEILYLGKKLQVCIDEEPTGKVAVSVADGVLTIVTPNKKDHFLIKTQLEMYTKEQALKLFTTLTDKYCNLLGCKYSSLTLRKQKTRWGSCSSKGGLSYNIRLMSAPIEVIEYVVLHEVMHLIYFDHSKAFWNAIAKVMSDYKIRQSYLKEQGNILDI